ncbi:hypothetical protein CIHG_01911 [Coccidioides immitis H538.4]|uniref:Uncharacterized protein n=1 Tax=Coccidioides immitis H538.4 TaxID=396776 RepID=A0A0J8RG11_COCIT|nr:hypothetical protein CIHG_01911 [Coccidioides immitis H538.4]
MNCMVPSIRYMHIPSLSHAVHSVESMYNHTGSTFLSQKTPTVSVEPAGFSGFTCLGMGTVPRLSRLPNFVETPVVFAFQKLPTQGPSQSALGIKAGKKEVLNWVEGWFAVCSSDGANSSTKRRRMIYSKDDGTRTPKYMTFGVRSPERGDCYTYVGFSVT